MTRRVVARLGNEMRHDAILIDLGSGVGQVYYPHNDSLSALTPIDTVLSHGHWEPASNSTVDTHVLGRLASPEEVDRHSKRHGHGSPLTSRPREATTPQTLFMGWPEAGKSFEYGLRLMQSGVDTSGGFLVPEDFQSAPETEEEAKKRKKRKKTLLEQLLIAALLSQNPTAIAPESTKAAFRPPISDCDEIPQTDEMWPEDFRTSAGADVIHLVDEIRNDQKSERNTRVGAYPATPEKHWITTHDGRHVPIEGRPGVGSIVRHPRGYLGHITGTTASGAHRVEWHGRDMRPSVVPQEQFNNQAYKVEGRQSLGTDRYGNHLFQSDPVFSTMFGRGVITGRSNDGGINVTHEGDDGETNELTYSPGDHQYLQSLNPNSSTAHGGGHVGTDTYGHHITVGHEGTYLGKPVTVTGLRGRHAELTEHDDDGGSSKKHLVQMTPSGILMGFTHSDDMSDVEGARPEQGRNWAEEGVELPKPKDDQPLTLENEAQVGTWGTEHYKKWWDHLTDFQHKALAWYAHATGGYYRQLNSVLRHKGRLSPKFYQIAQSVDEALYKAPRTTEDLHLFRLVGTWQPNEDALSGNIPIKENAYGSTSLLENNAYTWRAAQHGNDKNQTFMHITLPKGSVGAFLGPNIAVTRESAEFLLPRGTTYKVVGHSQHPTLSKRMIIHVVAQTPDKPEPLATTDFKYFNQMAGMKSAIITVDDDGNLIHDLPDEDLDRELKGWITMGEGPRKRHIFISGQPGMGQMRYTPQQPVTIHNQSGVPVANGVVHQDYGTHVAVNVNQNGGWNRQHYSTVDQGNGLVRPSQPAQQVANYSTNESRPFVHDRTHTPPVYKKATSMPPGGGRHFESNGYEFTERQGSPKVGSKIYKVGNGGEHGWITKAQPGGANGRKYTVNWEHNGEEGYLYGIHLHNGKYVVDTSEGKKLSKGETPGTPKVVPPPPPTAPHDYETKVPSSLIDKGFDPRSHYPYHIVTDGKEFKRVLGTPAKGEPIYKPGPLDLFNPPPIVTITDQKLDPITGQNTYRARNLNTGDEYSLTDKDFANGQWVMDQSPSYSVVQKLSDDWDAASGKGKDGSAGDLDLDYTKKPSINQMDNRYDSYKPYHFINTGKGFKRVDGNIGKGAVVYMVGPADGKQRQAMTGRILAVQNATHPDVDGPDYAVQMFDGPLTYVKGKDFAQGKWAVDDTAGADISKKLRDDHKAAREKIDRIDEITANKGDGTGGVRGHETRAKLMKRAEELIANHPTARYSEGIHRALEKMRDMQAIINSPNAHPNDKATARYEYSKMKTNLHILTEDIAENLHETLFDNGEPILHSGLRCSYDKPFYDTQHRDDKATQFLRRLVGNTCAQNMNILPFTKMNPPTADSPHGSSSYSNDHHGNSVIKFRNGADTGTFVHEMGHLLENYSPTLNQRALSYLNARTKGEQAENLSTLTGLNYNRDPGGEWAKKDKFHSPYCGKVYSFKTQNGIPPTEIVSMGVERLYRDPLGFALEDPDYFDFTINAVRGTDHETVAFPEHAEHAGKIPPVRGWITVGHGMQRKHIFVSGQGSGQTYQSGQPVTFHDEQGNQTGRGIVHQDHGTHVTANVLPEQHGQPTVRQGFSKNDQRQGLIRPSSPIPNIDTPAPKMIGPEEYPPAGDLVSRLPATGPVHYRNTGEAWEARRGGPEVGEHVYIPGSNSIMHGQIASKEPGDTHRGNSYNLTWSNGVNRKLTDLDFHNGMYAVDSTPGNRVVNEIEGHRQALVGRARDKRDQSVEKKTGQQVDQDTINAGTNNHATPGHVTRQRIHEYINSFAGGPENIDGLLKKSRDAQEIMRSPTASKSEKKAARDKYADAQKALNKATDRHRDEIHKILFDNGDPIMPDTASSTVYGEIAGEHVKNLHEQAHDFINRLAGASLAAGAVEKMRKQKLLVTPELFEKRSNYDPDEDTVWVTPKADTATYVHELGHRLEAISDAGVRSNAFLRYRTKGSGIYSLQRLTGVDRYGSDEWAAEDEFHNAYCGKIYDDNPLNPGDANVYPTEIMSMGLERIYRDPAGFARQDPEYFDFVINNLRGRGHQHPNDSNAEMAGESPTPIRSGPQLYNGKQITGWIFRGGKRIPLTKPLGLYDRARFTPPANYTHNGQSVEPFEGSLYGYNNTHYHVVPDNDRSARHDVPIHDNGEGWDIEKLEPHPSPQPADRITSKYFTGKGIQINYKNSKEGQKSIRQLFGRDLSDREISRLVGATDGAVINVNGTPDNSSTADDPMYSRLARRQASVSFEITSRDEPDEDEFISVDKAEELAGLPQTFYGGVSSRSIYTDPDTDELVLSNDSLVLKQNAPQGLGTHIFATQVDQARKLGIDRIKTTAVGNGAFLERSVHAPNGFYTWPRLGYDGPIDDRNALPAAREKFGEHVNNISDVMTAPGGPEWWKKNGVSLQLEFDLDSDSKSSTILDAYMRKKGYTLDHDNGTKSGDLSNPDNLQNPDDLLPEGARNQIEFTPEDERILDGIWAQVARKVKNVGND